MLAFESDLPIIS